MKSFTLPLIFFGLMISSGDLVAQAFMGFENLTTTQNCTNSDCQYVDPISATTAHDLPDLVGHPVNSPTSAGVLGFKSSFRPTRSGGTGLSDGDLFGYAGSATLAASLAAPTQGTQAFIAEDTDGEVTMAFSIVDLVGSGGGTFSMDYIAEGSTTPGSGFEGGDLLKISLEITGCGAATTLDLVNLVDGGINSIAGAGWRTASQDLTAYADCKVKLIIAMDSNSASEEFAFDNISFTGGIALPVEFMSFTANQYKESVILDWSTATETDNRGFSVERSLDGTSFAPIGWVSGSGNAGAQVDYQFEDSDVTTGRDYYYRLRQEDFDGAFDYSSIVNVSLAGGSKNKIDGRIYPNPANNGLSNLELFPTSDGAWTVSVLDANGRLITESKHNLSTGYNLVPLDLSTQPVGTYLVRVAGQKETIYRKVIR